MPDAKFYVRRFPVWGGGFHFAVAESSTRRIVSKVSPSEAKTKSRCARMNADWRRYESAMYAADKIPRFSLPAEAL